MTEDFDPVAAAEDVVIAKGWGDLDLNRFLEAMHHSQAVQRVIAKYGRQRLEEAWSLLEEYINNNLRLRPGPQPVDSEMADAISKITLYAAMYAFILGYSEAVVHGQA